MILKPYEINQKKISDKILLLYGLNEGYKSEIVNKLINTSPETEIIKYEENEVLINKQTFIDELSNQSLFTNKKMIIINRISNKFSNILDDLSKINYENLLIILNSGNLEKKSKLRQYFEKHKLHISIAFYEDNDQTLLQIINNHLAEKKIKISNESKSLIIERSSGDRINLLNEIDKIKNLSLTRDKIELDDILKLTNMSGDYSIFELVENYLSKNKKKISKILNESNYGNEDCILIIRTLLNRLKRLLKLRSNFEKNNNISETISSFKPPIFWKEKEIVSKQLSLWNSNKIKQRIYETYDLEMNLKKNTQNSFNLLSDFILNF